MFLLLELESRTGLRGNLPLLSLSLLLLLKLFLLLFLLFLLGDGDLILTIMHLSI